MEAAGDDVIGLGAGRSIVAAALPDVRGDVAANIVVHRGGSAVHRLFQTDHRRQRLKLDGNVAQRIFGEIAALREYDRERLADMADLVLGERHLGALIEDRVLDRRRRHQQRTGRPIGAEIGGGIDRDNAVAGARRGDIDRADAGMREIAAQKCRVHHAGQFDVVDEQRLAAQQPRVLVATDRRAETARAHGCGFRSRSAASCMAWTIC